MSIATDYIFSIKEKELGYSRIVGIEDSNQELNRFAKSSEGKLASVACQVLLILSAGDEYIEAKRAAQPFLPKKGKLVTTGPKIPRTIIFPKIKKSQQVHHRRSSMASKRNHIGGAAMDAGKLTTQGMCYRK